MYLYLKTIFINVIRFIKFKIFSRMIRIPAFFYEIYSNEYIQCIRNIHSEIIEIQTTIPEHCIVDHFFKIFFQMTESLQILFDKETMEEYYSNVKNFSRFVKKYKQLEYEINLFVQKKKIGRRVRDYYRDLFLHKKKFITSKIYQSEINLTVNSLMEKEIDQELFYLRQHNYTSRQIQPSLPILIEN